MSDAHRSPLNRSALTRKGACAALLLTASDLNRYVEAQLRAHGAAQISADDRLQDVCVAVMRTAPGRTFRDLHHFAAWIRGIADHKLLDARTHERRAHEVEQKAARMHAAAAPDIGETSGAERAELRHRLDRALAGLADLERRALLMRCVENLPREEIAARLGISVEEFKSLLKSAKGKMRLGLADLSL